MSTKVVPVTKRKYVPIITRRTARKKTGKALIGFFVMIARKYPSPRVIIPIISISHFTFGSRSPVWALAISSTGFIRARFIRFTK